MTDIIASAETAKQIRNLELKQTVAMLLTLRNSAMSIDDTETTIINSDISNFQFVIDKAVDLLQKGCTG